MTTFNEIQDAWNQQTGVPALPAEELIRVAKKSVKEIRNRHQWTIGIMACCMLLLAGYLIVSGGFRVSRFTGGISLMLFSLLLRLLLEQVSLLQFRKIDIGSDVHHYTTRITAFYRQRKKIHYLFTPVIIAAYIAGFVLLLPVFKRAFSTGFYWYIVSSGCLFFIVFSWLLARQIKKEMQLLIFLQRLRQ